MASGTLMIPADDSGGEVLNYASNTSALESITRAEIDTQIATAKRFPRSIERFMQESEALVSRSPKLAEKCTYKLKRKDDKGKDVLITGPSVRMAEMLALCWGNIRIVGRIVEDTGKAIVAQGVCLDLERNVGYSGESRRGVTKRNGDRYSEDMVNMTCNAAIAVATRNATFKAIPRVFVNAIWEVAQEVARGTMETLPQRINALLDYFGVEGVKDPEVYAALGVTGFNDLTLDHLATLQGFRVSLEDRQTTVDELFRPKLAPQPEERRPGEKKTDELARRMKDAKGKRETPVPAADAPPVTTPPPVAPSVDDDGEWADGHDEE